MVEQSFYSQLYVIVMIKSLLGVEGAGLVQWMGGLLGASFGFYLRQVFQSQSHKEKILYNESC